MQEIDEHRSGTPVAEKVPEEDGVDANGFDLDDCEPRPIQMPTRQRMLTLGGILLLVVLLITLPPLINVNRFRRQIARSVSASLGRPVRIDSVALTMLPVPGFTLQTFVVGEDPAFGSEPVLRADSVRLTLRWSSLWRRRVEFSRITLEDPSVNLVHLPDGRWNLESILLQAARLPVAPTGQKGAGGTPRFPYIEATGARVNVKQGYEKLPLSLTDARFSLWLPEPEQWQLRLEGRPTRTDAAPADTGMLAVEGTLGKAGRVEAVPVDLEGVWSGAPLGAVSQVLMGRDAGLRGEMTLSASVHGRLGENALTTRLRLRNLRRAEFVPERTLDVDVRCTAAAAGVFHQLHGVRCAWPASSVESGLQLNAEVPEVFRPATATGQVILKDVPLSGLLDGLRVASPRVGPSLAASGRLAADVSCCATAADGSFPAGSFALTETRVALGNGQPVVQGEVPGAFGAAGELVLGPLPLELGGATPAILLVTGSRTGYRMRLTGPLVRSRLLALAAALPQFGDGLAEALPAGDGEVPVRVDVQSARPWGGAQTWTAVPVPPAPVKRRRGRR